jgi:hypothetical protein
MCTASYGYNEEDRTIADECLCQLRALIGFGPGLCGLPRISLLRLSEKSRTRPLRSPTGRRKGIFGPFCLPYTGQIQARSVARTLFGQSL